MLIIIDQTFRDRVLAGRLAVDAYRQAHAQLCSRGWHKGIPEEHTPLLNKMLTIVSRQGFSSLNEFFDASEELNIQELGFKDREDFETRCKDADRQALDRMWH